MRRLLLLTCALGLLCCLVGTATGVAQTGVRAVIEGEEVGIGPATPTSRPNFVVIQTDDQALADVFAEMRDAFGEKRPVMPATIRRIVQQGMSFLNYYATYPLCCPARTTLLSGQYAHSNGVLGNSPPNGGWQGFRRSRVYRHNIATWLSAAGYRTIHIGKFLNGYGSDDHPESEVPPGWEVWRTDATDNSTRHFYGYMSNYDGTIRGPFGDVNYGRFAAVDPPGCLYGAADNPLCNHKTDWITRNAVEQIDRSAQRRRPFYLQLDYNAPHGDHQPPIGPEPTVRNYGKADGTGLPRTPSFNEADISDKPSFIREKANLLTQVELRRIRTEYRKTLESLKDVDDGIRRIIGALQRTGELENTYVIFTSDNGFFRGQHRLERAKFLPYEPAVHMPLFIRGPSVPKNSKARELVANIDLAPTILELARARPTSKIDGRTLVPFLRNPSQRTRRPILLEAFAKATNVTDAPGSGDGANSGSTASSVSDGQFVGPVRPGRRGEANPSISAPVENYAGVRLGRYKYVEYETGDVELYDLMRDPHELRNRVNFPNYRYVRGFLAHQLKRLVGCRGAECRFTTNTIPQPGRGKPRPRKGSRK